MERTVSGIRSRLQASRTLGLMMTLPIELVNELLAEQEFRLSLARIGIINKEAERWITTAYELAKTSGVSNEEARRYVLERATEYEVNKLRR